MPLATFLSAGAFVSFVRIVRDVRVVRIVRDVRVVRIVLSFMAFAKFVSLKQLVPPVSPTQSRVVALKPASGWCPQAHLATTSDVGVQRSSGPLQAPRPALAHPAPRRSVVFAATRPRHFSPTQRACARPDMSNSEEMNAVGHFFADALESVGPSRHA